MAPTSAEGKTLTPNTPHLTAQVDCDALAFHLFFGDTQALSISICTRFAALTSNDVGYHLHNGLYMPLSKAGKLRPIARRMFLLRNRIFGVLSST